MKQEKETWTSSSSRPQSSTTVAIANTTTPATEAIAKADADPSSSASALVETDAEASVEAAVEMVDDLAPTLEELQEMKIHQVRLRGATRVPCPVPGFAPAVSFHYHQLTLGTVMLLCVVASCCALICNPNRSCYPRLSCLSNG